MLYENIRMICLAKYCLHFATNEYCSVAQHFLNCGLGPGTGRETDKMIGKEKVLSPMETKIEQHMLVPIHE